MPDNHSVATYCMKRVDDIIVVEILEYTDEMCASLLNQLAFIR